MMIRTILFALLLSSAWTFSLAQSESGPVEDNSADAASEETTAGDETVEAAPDGDTPIPGDGPDQQEIVTEVIGDWELRCTAEKTNCFMYQLARDESLNPVSEISIIKLPEGGEAAAGVTVVTPLGTLLSEGLVIQVDSGRARQYAYNWCTRSGCFARFGFTAEDIAAMKRGSIARIRIVSVSATDRPIVLELSLSGFTKAFDTMTEQAG